MLKDRIFKIFSVLALTSISFYNIVYNAHLETYQTALSFLLFLIPSLLIVQGAIKLISQLRNRNMGEIIFAKIGMVMLTTSLFTCVVLFTFSLIWQIVFINAIDLFTLYKTCAGSVLLILFFTLIYEILFLTKERELDTRVVKHLDNELVHAEIHILKNELDPHFVYNSLMPLYYLIKNDVQKAESFTYKLMQVYQHFLEKRQNDFIELGDEVEFIKNYFYLLQIRFKDSIFLSMDVPVETSKYLVIPFSLQVLIENAIKHNHLDVNNPLHISIYQERNCLVVSNNFRPLTMQVRSSKIGLNNLRTRYKILTKRNISVLKNNENYIVKIPLLRNNTVQYDVNSNYRG